MRASPILFHLNAALTRAAAKLGASLSLPSSIRTPEAPEWWRRQWERPNVRVALGALLAAAAYYVGTLIGLAVRFQSSPISPIWPPNAIVLVALLLAPIRKWWVYALAVFGAHMLITLPSGIPVDTAIGLYFTNFAEAALGAFLVRRFIGDPPWLINLRQIAIYIACAVIAAPVLTSFADAAVVVLTRWGENYWLNWETRTVSNVLAELTIGPALLLALTGTRGWVRDTSRWRWLEVALLVAGVLVVSLTVFGGTISWQGSTPALVYTVLPLLLWAAIRFGTRGTSFALLGITVLATWSAAQGGGPFSAFTPLENVISLQLYLIGVSVPMLLLAGLMQEHQGTKRALQKSEARFRTAFESAATGMMLVDTNGHPTQINRPLMEMLGYSQEELAAHTVMQITHPDDVESNLSLFRAALAGKIDNYQVEKRFIHKDGHPVWALVSVGLVRDAAEQLRYFVSQVQDITERKRIEGALRASEERYRAVVSNFPRGVVLLFERDLRHVFADGQGLPDIGLSKESIEGKTIWEAFPADLIVALAPRYQAALAGKQDAFDLAHAGRTYLTHVQPITFGDRTAGMATLQDVTEQRRADALAELDQAKTAFFANVSHELRTPLTLLLAPTADALTDTTDPLPLRQRMRLELIQRNAMRLRKLVDTLLTFSRIEAGHIRATYEPTDVAALTANLASSFRSAAERAGLRLSVECSPLDHVSQPVYVDRDMWEQIVLNLISNALKFTPSGEISVSVRTARDRDERIQLEVRDTGIGIPAADLPHIFERFYRAQNAHARTIEGLGIGLALAHDLVRLHGGTVRAASEPGAGSAFTVTLPVGAAHLPADRIARHNRRGSASVPPEQPSDMASFATEAHRRLPAPPRMPLLPPAAAIAGNGHAAATQPQPQSASEQGAHAAPMGTVAPAPPARTGRPTILVVDDNADMRAYLVHLLGEHWDVLAADDGVAALASTRDQHPDLILADVAMPRMDGFALVSALRADPQTHALPVILLSARAGDEATADGLQAGAADYLVKPFSSRELLARVRTHLELARARREAEEHAAKLDAIFEAIGDGVLVYDLDGQSLHANHAYHELLRRHLELRGRHVDPGALITDPRLWDRYIAWSDEQGREVPPSKWAMERALRGEALTGAHSVDAFTSGADGQCLQVSVSAAPIRTASGRITGAVAVFRDVTEHRKLEQQVAEQASQLEAIFEAKADGIAAFDLQGRFVRANKALRQMLGIDTDADYISRPLSERAQRLKLFDEQGQPIPETQWPQWRVLRGETLAGANAMDMRLQTLDDREVWISATGAPIQGPDGQITGVVLVTREVTARRALERQAAEHASQLQAVFDAMTDSVFVLDANGRMTRINAAAQRLFGREPGVGFSADTAEGRAQWLDLRDADGRPLPKEQLPTRRLLLGEVLTGDNAMTLRVRVRDGRTGAISLTGGPLRDADGRITGAVGVVRDITELKRTEEALRQSEERFSKAFHASPTPMAILSLSTRRIVDVNTAEVLLTGYSREELIGATVGELGLIAPTDLGALGSQWRQEGRAYEAPLRVRTKSGEMRSCLGSTATISLGNEACLIVTTRDVTERERAEEALKRQERLFRTLVENSPDIIARFDRDLRYLYINPAVSGVRATPSKPIPPEEYIGKSKQELGWPESLYAPAQVAMEQVFQTGESVTLLEADAADCDAQDARYFRAKLLPEFDENGAVESVLSVTTEITDLKRTEEALRAATATAEAAQREAERRRGEAERRERIAASLRETLGMLNSDRQISKTLEYIAQQAGQLLGSNAVAIYMTDAGDAHGEQVAAPTGPESLTLQAAFGLRPALTSSRGKLRLSVGDAAVRRAMRTQRAVAVVALPVTPAHGVSAPQQGDADMEPSASHEHKEQPAGAVSSYIEVRQELLPAPYRTLLAIPIIAQGQAYGSMLLLYTAPRRFSDEVVALATAYGDQVALAVANARLQEHIGREATENERNRLARELHDTVTQEIFTASVLSESIPKVWERHREEAEANLHQVHRLIRGALAALRALLLELRPAVLEQKSLDELLQQLAEVMSTRSGAPIELTIDDDCPPIPIPVKVAFYRIAQEALMNTAKYANAHNIVVRLRSLPADEAIQLEIQDDGQGFNTSAIPAGHFGLGMMRERARAANARLRLTTRPGRGTRVTLRWTAKV